MNGLVSVMLIILYNSFNQYSLDYVLATYILDHYYEIENMSLKELSQNTHISISSINHFFNKFGFRSFSQVKEYINYGIDLRIRQIKNRYSFFDINKSLYKLKIICESSFDKKELLMQIDDFVDMIYKSDRIIVLGATYPSALTLLFLDDMIHFKKTCRFVWKNTYDYENKIEVSENELLLMISYTGRLMVMKNGLSSQLLNVKGKSALICNDELYSNRVDSFIKIPVDKGKDPEFQNLILVELLSIIKFRYYEKYILKDKR